MPTTLTWRPPRAGWKESFATPSSPSTATALVPTMIGKAADFRVAPRHDSSTFVEANGASLSLRPALARLESFAQLVPASRDINNDVAAITTVAILPLQRTNPAGKRRNTWGRTAFSGNRLVPPNIFALLVNLSDNPAQRAASHAKAFPPDRPLFMTALPKPRISAVARHPRRGFGGPPVVTNSCAPWKHDVICGIGASVLRFGGLRLKLGAASNGQRQQLEPQSL